MKEISIKNVRLHNLKNLDVVIPKNKLIVATGVSGSGKSSLMFDVVFEEGRKQYLNSLGILSEISNEEKFDQISGIGPTVAVQQAIIRQSNTRSTVGTRTNIINMLALLYSVEGDMECSSCGALISGGGVCKACSHDEEHLSPHYFSYNSSDGMCLTCGGRGAYFELDVEKVIPDEKATLAHIVDEIKTSPGFYRLFERRFKDSFNVPFNQLSQDVKDDFVYGHYENGKRSISLIRIFEGRHQKGEDLDGVYAMHKCDSCEGYRIGEEARLVTLNGKHIGQLCSMNMMEMHKELESLSSEKKLSTFSQNILHEILSKTNNLIQSRLGHLSLYREMPTLSGGELQRLFLNAHLDSKMDSLIYILDEPTAGLHESEKQDILKSIVKLKELGNTVIVVEHDKHTIQMAEHIIDIGPKAGIEGGEIIYQGDVAGLLKCENSITGQYLSEVLKMPKRTEIKNSDYKLLTVRNACTNNLKDLTVSIPLGRMVGIAGQSGSGKSSLISDTLLPLLKKGRNDQYENNGFDDEGEDDLMLVETVAKRLEGLENISGFAEISQAPIGRNMNSNPVTYIGIWDKIRNLFAKESLSLEQGFTSAHFSFNSKGACSECGGNGFETIWLGRDVNIKKTCKSCDGKRFNEEALSIRYNGKNINDVLDLSVSEAVEFFKEQSNISVVLNVMKRIGMGYIKLGQPTPTLSGGEAQRIKLAKELGKKRKGNILYILDEPTTGLSMYDTALLLELLDELVVDGNSVIVIEHDTEVLKQCDWIIELGPEGGDKGGYIIAEGTPQEIKVNSKSITGKYL